MYVDRIISKVKNNFKETPCSDVGAGSEPDKSQQEVLFHTQYQHYQNTFCLVTGETK